MKRLEENPLILPADVSPSRDDLEVVGAFNAGVARYGDEVILLLRVAERPHDLGPDWVAAPVWSLEKGEIEILRIARSDPDLKERDQRLFWYKGEYYLTSISHLRTARSKDGVNFTVDQGPTLSPQSRTETFGIEDPRITKIEGDYWITYKAVSEHGIATSLAQTSDFKTFTRHGMIFCPENLDIVLFPEKFDGRYAAWTRPVGAHNVPPAIWIARSPDLLHWRAHEPVLTPRSGYWDGARVGSSCVPFKTAKGWIEIYHGADLENRYSVGAALIDIEDPGRILARSKEPFMQPEAEYEEQGFYGKVVFPTGADVREDGEVYIYYGAADESTCAVTTFVQELLDHLES